MQSCTVGPRRTWRACLPTTNSSPGGVPDENGHPPPLVGTASAHPGTTEGPPCLLDASSRAAPSRCSCPSPCSAPQVPASASDDVDAPPASVSVRIKATQRVRLEALPQIVQQGGQVAGSDAARAAITATIRPVRVGRRVQLQVRQDLTWQPVATARQNRKGRAQFAAPASAGGDALTYRVKVRATAACGRSRATRSAPHAGSTRRSPTSSPAPSSTPCGTTAAASTGARVGARAPRATRAPSGWRTVPYASA